MCTMDYIDIIKLSGVCINKRKESMIEKQLIMSINNHRTLKSHHMSFLKKHLLFYLQAE
jgi:hypothetical protein